MEKLKSVWTKIVAGLVTAKNFVVSKLGVILPTVKSLVERVVAFAKTPIGRKVLIGVSVVLLLSIGYCVLKSHGKKQGVRIESVEAQVKANNDASMLDKISEKLGF